MIHVCTTLGKKCGIASFASKINKDLDANLVSDPDSSSDMLFEYEYGFNNQIPWPMVLEGNRKRIIIMHAFTAQHKQVNDMILKGFDRIVFLTKKAKIEAARIYPDLIDKIHVLPHYSENLLGDPITPSRKQIRVGMHGFGFPRNGFMKFLNSKLPLDCNVFISATLNSFNEIAEMETSAYIDKIRRKIWDINNIYGREAIRLDFDYMETKEEVAALLRKNCDILLHVQNNPNPNYINSSGSVHVLLATGLPVFTVSSYQTEMIPSTVINRVSSIDEFVSEVWSEKGPQFTSTPEAIREYHTMNTPKNFAIAIKEIMNGISDPNSNN